MAINFDKEYVKGNSFPRIIEVSVLQTSKREYKEDFEDAYLYWVETDVLFLNRMAVETMQDPELRDITSRIKKDV